MRISIKTVAVGIIYAFLALALLFFMPNTTAAIMFCVYLFIMAACCLKPRQNVYIILFMVAFFAFLLGRPMIKEFFNSDTSYYSVKIPAVATQYSYRVMTISLIFIYIGYIVSGKMHASVSWKIGHGLGKQSTVERIRQISRVTTLLLGVAQLAVNIENVIYVAIYGYLESYLRGSSMLPGLVTQLAELYPISFALYLATLPDKKKCQLPIVMYVFVMALYLLTGKRYETVSAVLLLLLYFVLRNRIDEENWIKPSQIRGMLILGPIAIVLLVGMETWRAGGTLDANFFELFGDFFSSVGGSSSVISYEYMYHDELAARGVWFSFGNVWRSLNGNAIAGFLGAGKVYASQTVENALYGHSLSSAIMYIVNPRRMLAGGGIGSCYIAELMCDFSYLGLMIGSYLIGAVIKKCNRLEQGSFIKNFLVVFVATSMFRIPRDSFDFFFYQIIGIKNILFLMAMYVAAKSANLWSRKA